jgi:DNA polymerase (family 10)
MTSKLTNIEIAELLDRIAFFKQMSGANAFAVKAFSNAARIVENYAGDMLADMSKQTGIGEKIAKAINEAATTGTMSELEKFKATLPDVYDLTKIAGVGPKRALKFYESYKITTRQELLPLLENGTIKDQKLLEAVKFALTANERMPRYMVEQRLGPLLDALRPLVSKLEMVGSMRRKRETIKDVDILVVTDDRPKVMSIFASFGNVLSQGPDKCSIQVDGGAIKFQTDLLCTTDDSWGAALNYFTGSKEHNVVLRTMAKAKGLTLNEYGIFKGEERIGGSKESDVYNILGLPYVPPELREGSDVMYKVPDIITRADLVCDAHMHTTYSDGKNTVDEMVQESIFRGLKQIGISDHIANAVYGNQLMTEEESRNAWAADIEQARVAHPEIKILKGAEIDISVDGDLALPPNINELDYVIASAHTVPHTNLTDRFLKAIKHPKVAILGHPTGKEYSKRGEGQADWAAVFDACAKAKVAIEINGIPGRLDLPEHLVRLAIAKGCKLICTSDAHNTDMIERNLSAAVYVARRAGVTAEHLITDLASFLSERQNNG